MAAKKKRTSKRAGSATTAAAKAQHADKVELLSAQLAEAKAELGRLRKRVGKHRVVEEAVRVAVEQRLDDVPPVVRTYQRSRTATKRTSGKHVERPQLILTDWQLGKVTVDYDPDVCAERVLRVVDKALHLIEGRRHEARIDGIDLCLLGDMVEGEAIFAGQAFETKASAVIDQAHKVADIVQDVVARLLANVAEVRVFGICGNHGRAAPRSVPQHKKSNWDRVAYDFARMLCDRMPERDRKRLDFVVPDRREHTHIAEGWRILKFHGDQVRGGFAGFPWYGLWRKTSGWKDIKPGSFDIGMHGHFHTPVKFTNNTTHVYGIGSTESHNTYAESELAAGGDPSQRLLFVSRDHGVIGDHELWCVNRKPFAQRIAEFADIEG